MSFYLNVDHGGTNCSDADSTSGSAVLAEVLAALAEMLYGSYFGPSVLISGVIQGLVVKVAFW